MAFTKANETIEKTVSMPYFKETVSIQQEKTTGFFIVKFASFYARVLPLCHNTDT